jgi:DNA repair exonuclease SbcCD ATPase subunit
MLTFRKLTWQNFLSTGNTESTVYLDRDPSTLIVGANGAGKSTMLDALSYALFGKPHRSINKPQLVNSINNKACLVSVEFEVGNIKYRIVRGMKPNIFEIYRNGKLLNQESHSRDYQKVLEQNILKLNHKSFHQVVVLGSSNFIPFMQLPSYQRRNVIEDLLDIGIFTKMNGVLKEKTNLLRSQMSDADHQLELLKETIKLQNEHLVELKRIDTTQESKRKKEVKRIEDEIYEIESSNTSLQTVYDSEFDGATQAYKDNQSKRHGLELEKSSLKTKMDAVVDEAKFYDNNNTCPTCAQDISAQLKGDKNTACKHKAKTLSDTYYGVKGEITQIASDADDLYQKVVHLNEVNSSIRQNGVKIAGLRGRVESLEEVVEIQDTKEAEEKLNGDREKREGLSTLRAEQSKVSSYLDAIGELLRDTGIKTKVIRQYLPVMNKLINQYLQVLDFFVLFNLDESFNETIKSRHRDEFTYASFSEGEKQRIDLSLLFAWRQIARMKNSANTNLLILDETFDSSMDADGVDNLLKILYTLGDETNVFVISHKQDLLEGKFPRKIEFEKVNNFSQIKKDGPL